MKNYTTMFLITDEENKKINDWIEKHQAQRFGHDCVYSIAFTIEDKPTVWVESNCGRKGRIR